MDFDRLAERNKPDIFQGKYAEEMRATVAANSSFLWQALVEMPRSMKPDDKRAIHDLCRKYRGEGTLLSEFETVNGAFALVPLKLEQISQLAAINVTTGAKVTVAYPLKAFERIDNVEMPVHESLVKQPTHTVSSKPQPQ